MDARHRDQRRVRQVVQRHTERVWVAVHRGAHPWNTLSQPLAVLKAAHQADLSEKALGPRPVLMIGSAEASTD